MNATRRALLAALEDGAVGGPTLADRLGVSRAAVWKQVEALRDEGFVIESGDEGYRVVGVPDYGPAALAFGLEAPYNIEYEAQVASTNDRAREHAEEGAADVVVVADEQTGGRGRLDREWTAPSGGVWASLVLRPERPPAAVPMYTLAAAVAVARAARGAGVNASIKWPNDVLVAGPDSEEAKLCGILTEMEGEADRVSWLVIGVGVNANIDRKTLPAGATSLRAEVGDVDRRRFLQRVLGGVHDLTGEGADLRAVLDAWREYASTLGRRVRVETPRRVVEGRAVDVQFPGSLIVETDNGERVVHAGDCEHLRPTR
ncbi:bifunctional biotin--[acetyl-CoA-carboxylase] synthetase/biotin operon repressor [Halobellus salinus]|uniref:Bifunctional biotin--[acetyl-CoA-carboxylase] synthetase/biotin operon repressor n=1 Tax=Halobellus salinus TaxID=931585 RepID=A0A830EAH2_9EURY|nr:biotin--[acetyl-CoA-carboxylase] ligase [Halobellus salinus]GGJ06873.1 bifunctional biotin--[acetyl-CoA-carboxylase] synthetase/biotin operon repressor [Halobellus salinus]SMP15282.1 BirA family transcriptional regulator, biotin operon repressor / biotin-[acetyl-CoA-carboxylase] ligase [Halobellus salinus]